MLQNDMTGYVGDNGPVIGIVTDHVDEKVCYSWKNYLNKDIYSLFIAIVD